MITMNHNIVKWRKTAYLALFLGCVLFLLGGCGTLKSAKNSVVEMYDSIKITGERVKRRIAIVPFQNRTPWDENQSHTLFMAELIQILEKKCPHLILVRPGDPEYPELITRFFSSEFGAIDNIGLAKLCQETGLNGVLTGQLTHIRSEEVKKGIIGFRKPFRVARIQLDTALYHAGTGAKLMDESYSFDVEMIAQESETSGRKWVIHEAGFGEPLSDCAKSAANAVCEKSAVEPWESVVLSIQDDKAIIPFGQSIGLRVGDKLEVFGPGNTVGAQGGYRYIIPGLKTGEMKITAVFPRNVEAAAENNTTFKVGSIVRFKK